MAAGATYVSIASETLSSAASSVTFSSISGAYTDLVLVGSVIGSTNDQGLRVTVNGDTTSGFYSSTTISGGSSAIASNRTSNANLIYLLGYNYGVNTTYGVPFIFSFMNYSNTTTNKTILGRSLAIRNDGGGETYAKVGLWRNTAAITSMVFTLDSGNIASSSTFSLYGIAAA